MRIPAVALRPTTALHVVDLHPEARPPPERDPDGCRTADGRRVEVLDERRDDGHAGVAGLRGGGERDDYSGGDGDNGTHALLLTVSYPAVRKSEGDRLSRNSLGAVFRGRCLKGHEARARVDADGGG